MHILVKTFFSETLTIIPVSTLNIFGMITHYFNKTVIILAYFDHYF